MHGKESKSIQKNQSQFIFIFIFGPTLSIQQTKGTAHLEDKVAGAAVSMLVGDGHCTSMWI